MSLFLLTVETFLFSENKVKKPSPFSANSLIIQDLKHKNKKILF